MDKNMAGRLIKSVTSYSKHYGVVNIDGAVRGVTRFANSQISQNINQSDLTLTLTLHDGKKEATSSTNVLDDAGLKKLASDTEALLNLSPPGDFEAADWHYEELPDAVSNFGGYDSVKRRVEAVKEGIFGFESEYTAAGALTAEKKIAAYGNSASDKLHYAELDNVQFNTVVTNNITNADGGAECISHKGEMNIIGGFAEAKQRVSMGSDPLRLDAGAYTVLLSPKAIYDLFSFITWSLNGKFAAEGMSFVGSDLKNAPRFGSNITIRDDVGDNRLFPWYFDYEGKRRQPLTLVEGGLVKNLLHDRKTSPTQCSGHAISNKGRGGFSLHTIIHGGQHSLDEMVKSVKHGLFISELHYTNFVNPRNLLVTGLTRNGTFLIKDGTLGQAVTTMRFTQNLIEALGRVISLSDELSLVDSYGWAALAPYAVIEGFNFP